MRLSRPSFLDSRLAVDNSRLAGTLVMDKESDDGSNWY